jgi:hypothetical protein
MNSGGQDKTSIGKTSNRGVEGFAAYVSDPSKFGNNVMPKFDFDNQQLSQLAAFLLASKGPK